MPPALGFFRRHWLAALAFERRSIGFLALGLLHFAALGILLQTEDELVPRIIFLCAWVLLNSLWLALLRRPVVAASASLIMLVVLLLASKFKQDVLIMSANFLDVLLIDADTLSFLMTVYPNLRWWVAGCAAVAVPLIALFWWVDPLRVRLRWAALGALASVAVLSALSLANPMDRDKAFEPVNFISQFARSGVLAAVDLSTRGLLDSDAAIRDRLPEAVPAACPPAQRLPHIVMVLDESSFDIGAVPGIEVPANYHNHFRSFDGKNRSLLVEGAGGPTWYTEYNVLSGLSARSFGHFAEFVTRIAAGRVTRSLPNALRPCGYTSFSVYPWLGAFLSARGFQKTLGIDHFLDAKDLNSKEVETDEFYYNYAADLIAREKKNGPVFVLSYLMANHFPWSYRWRPDLAKDWQDLGNGSVNGHRIDEYLRRQEISARAYQGFVERLKRDFPGEPFLIVRFGDHQPLFAKHIVDPKLDSVAIGRRIDAGDPRYFTTYYAIDALNFRPAELSSAASGLDAAYLPLVVLEAAGVPLDATFAEQKRILGRCNGQFYLCANGAEVRRFNRLLIDAGLIKQL
ncbi:MAG: sulfatase-like hydrolase/transferase [Xanthobacteraceae bacterium]|nr:sulfatase-like hydrolase/transferase [Xanthobacteraceae bacterium]